MKSGPCTYDSKYLSQIDRFCGRAVKYGYIAKFTPTAAGSEIKSAGGGGGELKMKLDIPFHFRPPHHKRQKRRPPSHFKTPTCDMRTGSGGGRVRIKNEMP